MTLILLIIVQFFSIDCLASGNDLSGYNLFNPTPTDKMRPLTTDRPDKTESPYTVDPGRFQIEADIIKQTRNKVGDSTSESTTLGSLNMKAGLTHNLDFQVVADINTTEKVSSPSVNSSQSGFGTTTLRLKWNMFGNDSGDVAMGFMPYVILAGGQGGPDKTTPGLIFLTAVALPNEWSTAFMLQGQNDWAAADDKYYQTVISTMTFGHSIFGELAGYFEFYSQSSNDPSGVWVATFDTGLTYQLCANNQLDFGINWGITESAPDFNPFLGYSIKF